MHESRSTISKQPPIHLQLNIKQHEVTSMSVDRTDGPSLSMIVMVCLFCVRYVEMLSEYGRMGDSVY